MTQTAEHPTRTRMLFLGEAPLTDGFRLIGFETWADPTTEQVEKVVKELVNKHQNAFVVIDQRVADANIPVVNQVRGEGGHIVITVAPPLNDPEGFRLPIDDRLSTLFGASNLLTKG